MMISLVSAINKETVLSIDIVVLEISHKVILFVIKLWRRSALHAEALRSGAQDRIYMIRQDVLVTNDDIQFEVGLKNALGACLDAHLVT